ncbi:cytosine permease [Aquisphaera giovannonii]|uniref:Cytosine permease n=1 Tax=Aquisphaera giovannonii TaxID=406548 RepID=A0A5B9VYE0_9BACT|nr:cytosine permease [Aquisphaera giovannonii]QEH32994.1 cytosine permease [Aquisphaera giovannonii]
MSTPTTTTAPGSLPDYIASASPNPPSNRAPWYKNTAPTYAGVFLWFAFWNSNAARGLLTGGLMPTLVGIVLAALICHFLFYVVPGLLGLKTGLPLYVVGTSTFGTVGGLLMPGFLMGALQFGWLGVNAFFSSGALSKAFGGDTGLFYTLCVIWTALAAFVGLKGIQYVAKVATYLPLIPFAVLIIALALFAGSASGFKLPVPTPTDTAGALWSILVTVSIVVGFFATAGAAGVDFGTNSRDANDVQMGGYVGIIGAIVLTMGIAAIALAGALASGALQVPASNDAVDTLQVTDALATKLSPSLYKAIMIGLTLASFPGACFSSFIAANSFKTVMPRVNPFISVGIGAIVSMALAITGIAGKLPVVFGIIGASFGPICGAMVADYLLAGNRWSGPRAGFNPAGWIAWALGFFVGVMPNLHKWQEAIPDVPAAPVAAFVVGFVVYYITAKIGMLTPVVPMPNRIDA